MRPPERSVRFPQGGAHPANAGMLFLVFFRALSYFRGPTGWMSTQTKDQGLQYLATTPGLHFPLLLKLRRNPQATHESPSLILGHVCPFISGMLGKKQQRCLPVGGGMQSSSVLCVDTAAHWHCPLCSWAGNPFYRVHNKADWLSSGQCLCAASPSTLPHNALLL